MSLSGVHTPASNHGGTYRHGREPTGAAADFPIRTYGATTIPTLANRPASSSSSHRGPTVAARGDGIGNRWRSHALSPFGGPVPSSCTGQRGGSLLEKTRKNPLGLRREGPLLLPARLRPQSQERDLPVAPGAEWWRGCKRGCRVTVRGDPPGRGLTPGLSPARADAAPCE